MRFFLPITYLPIWLLGTLLIIGLGGCVAEWPPLRVGTNLGPNFDKARIVQEPVAVVPAQPTKEGDFFADVLSNELLGVGFRIIERVRLETLLREQQLSLTGLLERQDYVQIGKMASIRNLFIISVVFTPKLGNVSNASLKLVDVNTGEVLISTNYTHAAADGGGLFYQTNAGSAKKIAHSIVEKIGMGASRP